jgi:hypothetical protein
MPPFLRSLRLVPVLAIISLTSASSQKSLDLNLGLSVSKSVLGAAYTDGMNQFNAGLYGFSYASRTGWFLEPGIAYNRYLTRNGFYVTSAYTFRYRDMKDENKGWESGLFLTGLGKSFQFTHWGLHADAGLSTPATADFARRWGWWFGGAVSYRFHLNQEP